MPTIAYPSSAPLNGLAVSRNSVASVSNGQLPKTNVSAASLVGSNVTISAVARALAKGAAAPPPKMSVSEALAAGDNIKAGTIISDSAANVTANLKNLSTLNSFSNIASITLSDKTAIISLAREDLTGDLSDVKNTDSNLAVLRKITSPYKLQLSGLNVSDALGLKSIAKTVTLSLTINDSASNISSNWDRLQVAAKSKTLLSISVSDNLIALLKISKAQMKSDVDAFALVTGNYQLAVTDVAFADMATTLKVKNVYSVSLKDSAANILKNLTSIQTTVASAKIQTVTLSDTTNPALSLSDIYKLKSSLPNLTMGTGIKFNISDTANMIIAHARNDIAEIIANAGAITLTDKSTPNLTLADAITLKGLTNLNPSTKYNVVDGGGVIAAQASISGEKILSGASLVTINKNFTIAEAKAITGLPTLAKGTLYSISDSAENILKQSALIGEKILSGANTVTIIDSSSNIIKNLDQLETLAKAGKIADIKFTDSPSEALDITQDQLVKDAEAIGKIISQRILPKLISSTPTTPAPYGSLTFDLTLPAGVTNFQINGYNDYSSSIYGSYWDNFGMPHPFKTQIDGSGFVDLTPFGAINASVNSFTPDGKRVWGVYSDENSSIHAFVSKIDGSNFVDLSPFGSSYVIPNYITKDGTRILGNFYEQKNGQLPPRHAFSVKIDGTGFVNLTPKGAKNSWMTGVTRNSTIAYGTFEDQNNNSHAFVSKIDGTGFVDLTPSSAKHSYIIAISPDESIALGNYIDQNNLQHLFSIKLDGTSFVDLTPKGALGFRPQNISANSKTCFYILVDNNQQSHAMISQLDGSSSIDISSMVKVDPIIQGISQDGNWAWGLYSAGEKGEQHAFTINTDGTNFVDLTPDGAIQSEFRGLISSNSKVFGNFTTSDGLYHAYIADYTGKNFRDLTPDKAISSGMGGYITEKNNVWGLFRDQNGLANVFSSNLDGTAFRAVPIKDASIIPTPIMSNGKLFGTYQTISGQWRGFIVDLS